MTASAKKIRKHLSADALFQLVRSGMEKIDETAKINPAITISDILMSGFAMFSLKDPSLLAFDERRKTDNNLRQIYHIDNIPCDTQMRTRLDEVTPTQIRPLFKDVFRQLQRGKALEQYVYINGCYLLSLDGTGYFSSDKVHCESCQEKRHQKTGKISYSHHILGAAIVHPDLKEVIPVAPEPIIKQDGQEKNDCERNASKRFLKQVRKDHPHLKLISIEDALSPNAPHIRDLQQHNFHYILGVKRGDHPFLFQYVDDAHKDGKVTGFEFELNGTIHRFRFLNHVPLNASNQDLLVNFVEYWEIKPHKTQHFSWITDFIIRKDNVYNIMRGGRARWKIENETFNTIKNQGYHFEHNYGHGKKNLSVVFAYLMMLAFLVDQAQQLACGLFQAVWKEVGSKIRLWERIRSLFQDLEFDSMEHLYNALLYGYKINGLVILNDSS
jgi:hypothetical protein